ncbi:hypothetical protein [Nocardioides mesophilus]|uniref:Uncharacterized protein n=1 Tax=Nocardioides mesophilus TaxID=433659 RepID=A0A7G9RCD3_9ACTN|nr:hypothetical protein [Nocardioides mesophilus]QNN53258.1 hypothetical protein H9L09_01865 [Nocardioides mesophilus]
MTTTTPATSETSATSTHRTLVGLLVALLLLCAVGAVLGVLAIGSDLQQRGEFLDGLGVMIGLGLLGLVLLPASLALLTLRALRRGRPSTWLWATATGTVGGVCVLPFLLLSPLSFPLLVVPVALSLTAFWARTDFVAHAGEARFGA